MAPTNSQSFLASLMSPTPLALLIGILLVLSVPLFLHFVIYRSPTSSTLPTFLLVGPSNSGKTSLLTLFETGRPSPTRTSQTPLTVELSLPLSTPSASSKYRSSYDPSTQFHKKFLLADTPGHGKLRYHAFDSIMKPQNLRGIIFMVDAADISSTSISSGGGGNEALRQTAEYLHDLLLLLQKRANTKTARAGAEIPVLVAANKLDLFTALPSPLVKSALENEITKIRDSRNKGLLDSGIGMDSYDSGAGEEREWLGEGGEGKFEFGQMEDSGVRVSVVGGNVAGGEGADVQKWWGWIGENL